MRFRGFASRRSAYRTRWRARLKGAVWRWRRVNPTRWTSTEPISCRSSRAYSIDHDVEDDTVRAGAYGAVRRARPSLRASRHSRTSRVRRRVDLPSLAESVRSVEERIARQGAEYEALSRLYEKARDARSGGGCARQCAGRRLWRRRSRRWRWSSIASREMERALAESERRRGSQPAPASRRRCASRSAIAASRARCAMRWRRATPPSCRYCTRSASAMPSCMRCSASMRRRFPRSRRARRRPRSSKRSCRRRAAAPRRSLSS